VQDATATLREQIDETLAARLDTDTEWTVAKESPDSVTVSLPDRTLVVHRRDGPDGADHWTLDLVADAAIVSKFGPFDDVEAVCENLQSVLEGDVRYTVCCDG